VSAVSGNGAASAVTGGSVAPNSNSGVMPSAASGNGGSGTGAGASSTVAYAGVGFPPLEVRVGQGFTPATGSAPTTPGTEGFTVSSSTGRVIPTPVGYVHPPQASHFHGPQSGHVSHSPMRVENHVVNSEAYEPYKAPYVWPGSPKASPPPAFLASDYLKPSPYEPPHLLFADERPSATVTVDGSISPRGSMQTDETVIRNLSQDFSESRNVEFTNNTYNDRNVTLDNSINRTVDQSFPEYREVVTNLVFAQSPPMSEQVLSDPSRFLGGPVMARVA